MKYLIYLAKLWTKSASAKIYCVVKLFRIYIKIDLFLQLFLFLLSDTLLKSPANKFLFFILRNREKISPVSRW